MGAMMEKIKKEMDRAGRSYYAEYFECEKCGEDRELWWFNADSKRFWATGTEEDNWDWACACDRCGYLARFSKDAGKLEDVVERPRTREEIN